MAKIPKNIKNWKWKIVERRVFLTLHQGPFGIMRQTDKYGDTFWIVGRAEEFHTLSELLKAYQDDDRIRVFMKDAIL